jgi:UDP-glucose 4-epimerase
VVHGKLRIAVTGSEGFIGKKLIERLKSNQVPVLGIDIKPSSENTRIVDITKQSDLHEALNDFNPTHLFHLAAQTDVRTSMDDPLQDANVNILGTINVGVYVANNPGVRLVYLNSGGAIYDSELSISHTEAEYPKPLSPYGISKLTGEQYLYNLIPVETLTSIRLSNVYGEGQINGVIPLFINNLIRGEMCKFYGDGTSSRDYIHVEDVIDFCLHAVVKSLNGTFNVSSNTRLSLRDLHSNLCTVLNLAPKIEYLPRIDGEIQDSVLDNTLALRTGWKPTRVFFEEIDLIAKEEKKKLLKILNNERIEK